VDNEHKRGQDHGLNAISSDQGEFASPYNALTGVVLTAPKHILRALYCILSRLLNSDFGAGL